MCRAIPVALQCRLLFTTYPWQKENQKHTKYHIISVIFVPVCRTRLTKIRISISQLYTRLCIIHKKGRFHDTPLELVQNVHRFASCAIGQVMLNSSSLCPYSTKAINMVKTRFRCYLRLCTEDLEPKWAATWSNCKKKKVTHYPQITKFPWPMSRMCTAMTQAALYFLMSTHQESKTHEQ